MLQTPLDKSTLLSPALLTANQDLCLSRLYENDATLVIAEMGFGKTVVTLSAIKELIDDAVISRVLVLAPLKVCKTVWQSEAVKWSHLYNLEIAAAIGPVSERVNAIKSGAKVVLMNYENLPWFCDTFKSSHGFDGLVCDEITKLKSSGGKGFKKLRHRLKDFNWRCGLSGTPVSEDFQGLYSMIHVLDSGERLGGRKDLFMRKYFFPTDYKEYNWALTDATGATILNAVSDLIFVADNAAYKQSLPPISHTFKKLKLPPISQAIYDDMKRDAVANGVAAANAAVVVGKLLQISSGFLYGDIKNGIAAERLHDIKLTAVVDLVDKIAAPVIIAYWFKNDLEALQVALPNAVVMSGSNDNETIDLWNKGEIPVLLLQPRSAGHGLQLQGGGSDLIWFGPVWSRDLVLQTEARLWRQGQKNPVRIYTLLMDNTIEVDVSERVDEKASYSELLAAHLG